jgi:hypothetical protein
VRNRYLLWLALLITVSTSAQHLQAWYNGSITLADNQVLVGRLSNSGTNDFVVFQSAEGKATILAHEIKSLRYYDSLSNINRQFVSIKHDNPFQFYKLYEVVIQGKVKVLRKPRRLFRPHSLHEISDYNYFVEYNEELIPIKKFRAIVYPELIRERPIEVEQFVSMHHLNINEMKAALLILKEYNQLQSKKELVAKLNYWASGLYASCENKALN